MPESQRWKAIPQRERWLITAVAVVVLQVGLFVPEGTKTIIYVVATVAAWIVAMELRARTHREQALSAEALARP